MTPYQIKQLAKQAGAPDYIFTPYEMNEFVRLVRERVLDEAAAACTAIAIAPSNCVLGVAITCADAIRSLK